ncbi:hypothetical protein LCGC14_0312200 [marine sediment metagenome]|uniref:Glycoside hydrolase family 38 N-terminal domain-containing protein n=1 Tax=marine sediment metagenome TaxID=412755 RepID=A0A0F9WTF1_9ZZZZ|nr:hypothetical protein [Phycisphaerae bacterium]HDZ43277.1 hypothetical protein [Phycisphaerae bacterium]
MASMKLLNIEPTIFFKKRQAGLVNLVKVAVNNGGNKAEAQLAVKGGGLSKRVKLGMVAKGENVLEVMLPEIEDAAAVHTELLVNDKCVAAKDVTWAAPKKWDVHLIHYSHHDFGYTDLPSRVLDDCEDFYDEILDHCESTKDWDKDARFRYQIEQAWSVLHWADRRPQSLVKRLMSFAKKGQIEIPALFGNQTSELCGHEELHRLMYPSYRLKREYGVQVTSAMHNDVPGFSWGLVGAMAAAGVKYFCLGVPIWYFTAKKKVHPCWDEAAVHNFGVPGPWWWETPDGQRLLTWYNLHGMEFRPAGEQDCLTRLPEMLKQFDELGYAWNIANFTVSSGHRDNSPPTRFFADFVRKWNGKWAYPHFVNSTNTQFLDIISEQLPDDTKVLRGEFPNTDYTVCATSTPHETGVNRNGHQALRRGETYATIASQVADFDFPKKQIDKAYIDTFYHDLHCWGMAHPGGPAMDACVAEKSMYAFRTLSLGLDLEMKAANRIADNIRSGDGHFLTVFNPLAHSRSEVVTAALHEWAPCGLPMVPSEPDEHGQVWIHSAWCTNRGIHPAPDFLVEGGFEVIDTETGRVIPAQIVEVTDPFAASPHASERIAMGHQKTATDLLIAAKDIPPVGYKTFKLVQTDKPATFASCVDGLTIDNDFVTLTVDAATGNIASLFDKELGRDLVDGSAPHGLTQLIVRSAETMEETPVKVTSVEVVEDGPVFTTVRVKGEAVSMPRFTKDITVFHAAKRIDVALRGLKDGEPTVEAFMAFPFDIDKPQFRFEASGSVIEPTVDQLPGSNTDYYAMQHWADVFNDEGGVVFTPLDSPMAEFGGLYPTCVSGAHHHFTNAEYGHEWLKPGSLTKGHIYSMLYYNNYGTNFVNTHAGEILMRFSFAGHKGGWQDDSVRQYGWDLANPCWCIWLPGGQKGSLPAKSHSFVTIDAGNIELSTYKPAEDGKGLILRVMETAGKATDATIKLSGVKVDKATLTNTMEEGAEKLKHTASSVKLSLPAFGTATVRLKLKKS